MSTRQVTLILIIVSFMLAVGCGSDTSDSSAGKASSSSTTKTGFPEAAYKKVEEVISTGPDVLNEKMIKDIVSIAPEVGEIAISAVQAMDRDEYLAKLDTLAGKIGMKDHKELLGGARALQKAGFAMETLLDLEERFADGDEKLIPGMYYDNCKKMVGSEKLTRADLELMLKNMDTIKPVEDDLATIAGTCLMLLNK